MNKNEKHEQCMQEIKATLILTAICCVWHISSAFLLNGSGKYFLGMPAWFSVSVFGTIIIAIAGVVYLTKYIFKDFDYDDEKEDGDELK